LVEQQAKYLSVNTPLRVYKLFGALDIELSDRMRWKRRLQKCDVLVMTRAYDFLNATIFAQCILSLIAQILVNLITHSLWSLDRVSLLVFDECHHARKNHPYNIIMREYFHIKTIADRPRVFGMTASPVWNTKDPLGSLLALETNLDSKIISVLEHVEELAAHSPRPSEVNPTSLILIHLYPYLFF
jgi:endoribonuclease Dicer